MAQENDPRHIVTQSHNISSKSQKKKNKKSKKEKEKNKRPPRDYPSREASKNDFSKENVTRYREAIEVKKKNLTLKVTLRPSGVLLVGLTLFPFFSCG